MNHQTEQRIIRLVPVSMVVLLIITIVAIIAYPTDVIFWISGSILLGGCIFAYWPQRK